MDRNQIKSKPKMQAEWRWDGGEGDIVREEDK